MKNKLFITLVLAVVISSCSTPQYLPGSDFIDVNQYGSYITIKQTTQAIVKGELLALDSIKLIVLVENENSKKPVVVPINEVSRFILLYARPKHYGWTIPTGLALPLLPFSDPDKVDPAGGGKMPFHGFYALLSIPINLIVTISVTKAGEKAFTYSNKKMTYDKLKMFARFPQGIPPNIDIASIK